jgi:hypothetical protein
MADVAMKAPALMAISIAKSRFRYIPITFPLLVNTRRSQLVPAWRKTRTPVGTALSHDMGDLRSCLAGADGREPELHKEASTRLKSKRRAGKVERSGDAYDGFSNRISLGFFVLRVNGTLSA